MIQEIASEIGEVFRNLKRKDLKSLGKIKSFTLDSGIKLVFQWFRTVLAQTKFLPIGE